MLQFRPPARRRRSGARHLRGKHLWHRRAEWSKAGCIGKFKGPVLRGVVAHAPYFHNGSAASLEDVVEFYDSRFMIGLNAQEKRDLVAFLRAL